MVTLNLPQVKAFGDYHEIDEVEHILNDFSNNRVKSKEIGFNGSYWAVFYEGKLPDKKEIYDLIKSRGFNPNDILTWKENSLNLSYSCPLCR